MDEERSKSSRGRVAGMKEKEEEEERKERGELSFAVAVVAGGGERSRVKEKLFEAMVIVSA